MASEVLSIAAPIRDDTGSVIATMAISIPASRMKKAQLDSLAKPLCQAADQLSGELGFKPRMLEAE